MNSKCVYLTCWQFSCIFPHDSYSPPESGLWLLMTLFWPGPGFPLPAHNSYTLCCGPLLLLSYILALDVIVCEMYSYEIKKYVWGLETTKMCGLLPFRMFRNYFGINDDALTLSQWRIKRITYIVDVQGQTLHHQVSSVPLLLNPNKWVKSHVIGFVKSKLCFLLRHSCCYSDIWVMISGSKMEINHSF